jgi:hypothetical protein
MQCVDTRGRNSPRDRNSVSSARARWSPTALSGEGWITRIVKQREVALLMGSSGSVHTWSKMRISTDASCPRTRVRPPRSACCTPWLVSPNRDGIRTQGRQRTPLRFPLGAFDERLPARCGHSIQRVTPAGAPPIYRRLAAVGSESGRWQATDPVRQKRRATRITNLHPGSPKRRRRAGAYLGALGVRITGPRAATNSCNRRGR